MGTFLKTKEWPRKCIRSIVEIFGVKKVFVFKIGNNNDKFLITFNITKDQKKHKLTQFKEKFASTIQLHRNKDTNTLYTINSLNKIIEIENGSKDKDFKINWNLYKNTLLLLKNIKKEEPKLDIVNTKLFEVLSF